MMMANSLSHAADASCSPSQRGQELGAFNLSLAGARLVYATVQPLTVLHTDAGPHYFFLALEGMETEYCLATDTYLQLSSDARIITEVEGKVYVTVDPGAERSFTLTAISEFLL